MRRSIYLMVLALSCWLMACGGVASMSADSDASRSYGDSEMASMEEVSAESDGDFGDMADDGMPMLAQVPAMAPPAQPAPAPAPAGPPPPPPNVTDVPAPVVAPAPTAQRKATPLLIYTARLQLAVFEAVAGIDAVQKLALESGGYLVKRSDRSITVRVPSEKFRASVAAFGKLGDVLHRDESVTDVTEQFYDLRTRLRSAHAMRDRLQQLLLEAKDVKEALAVERELGRVTANIERMEGKLKRMRELIAFSTITVEFRPRRADRVKSKVKLPFPWLNRLGLSELLRL